MNLKLLMTIAAAQLMAVSSAVMAQSAPIDVRLKQPLPVIEYQPFSGKSGKQLLQIEFTPVPDFSDIEGVAENDSIQQPRRVSLRIRPSILGAFAARGESDQLPISLRLNSRKGQFDFFDNEYRHNFTVMPFSNETTTVDYEVYVTPGIFAVAGLYKLPLYVGIVDVATQAPLTDLIAVDVHVLVRPRLQVNIAGTRSSAGPGIKIPMIDFAELETGESQRVFIQLRGNAPATITVSSENNGRLKGSEPATFIDYSVTVDNISSDLSQPLSIKRPVIRSLSGASYPMQVKVGNVEGAFAGIYEDMITVEVRPQ